MPPLSANGWHILAICTFPVVAALSVAGSVFLAKISIDKGQRLWFALGVMFSGGIFIATALVHSLPHASQLFERALSDDNSGGVSVQETTTTADTTMQREIEILVECAELLDGSKSANETDLFGVSSSGLSKTQTTLATIDDIFPWANMIFGVTFFVLLCLETYARQFVDAVLERKRANKFKDHRGITNMSARNITEMEDPLDASSSGGRGGRRGSTGPWWILRAKARETEKDGLDIITEDEEQTKQQQIMSPWVSILLFVILSVHKLLQGLTLGSDPDVDSIKRNLIPILIHKVFSAFALGSSFVASGMLERKGLFVGLIGAYILFDLLGIGVGMLVGRVLPDSSSIGQGILQAMLGGSFFFVAIMELIPGELEKMRLFKLPPTPILVCLGLGFALMAVVERFV